MSLTEKINKDIVLAMKAKDQVSLRGLRAIKAALLLVATEKSATEKSAADALDETKEIAVLQKLMKQRTDALGIYQTQNRADLAQKEQEEIAVIEKYLPQPLSDAELEAMLRRILEQCGVTDIKGMGKAMGVAQAEIAGRADNKAVSDKIKAILGV